MHELVARLLAVCRRDIDDREPFDQLGMPQCDQHGDLAAQRVPDEGEVSEVERAEVLCDGVGELLVVE